MVNQAWFIDFREYLDKVILHRLIGWETNIGTREIS